MNANWLPDKIQKKESFLIGNDGQFLGKLTLNKFDVESISNPYGNYGSKFSTTSIFNKFSNYGSPYSSLSPFNQYTQTPPMIYLKGVNVGLLTKNKYISSRSVDPDGLFAWIKNQGLIY